MWKPPKHIEINDRHNSRLGLLKTYCFIHRRWTWLLITVVLFHLLLLHSGMTAHNRRSSSAAKESGFSVGEKCPYGKVYVYEIPAVFNAEIVKNCENLNPWHSRCDALSNYGFGKSAAADATVSTFLPENIADSWFWTDQFSLELIHHRRILNYSCRTTIPESASAFYIPIYTGLAIEKSLFLESSSAVDRDRHCDMILDWVKNQPYFKKSNGWDHFLTMGRISWDFRRSRDQDWGSSCIYKPTMRNITRLLIERNPWDNFDVGVPYPTGFHPSTAGDLVEWQNFVRTQTRKTLFSFAGATRTTIKDDFRSILLRQCAAAGNSCRKVDCSASKCEHRSSAALEAFLGSEFCLQPRGDSFTRRSVFDCMIAGAIPVFFWRRTAYMQYKWFLPSGERESYSVFVDRTAVKNGTTTVKSVLEKINKETVTKMREKIIENLPKLIYVNSDQSLEGVHDAFDVAMEGVLRRIGVGHGRAKNRKHK